MHCKTKKMKKLFLLSALISTSLLLNAQTRSGRVSDVQVGQRNQTNQPAQTAQQRGFQRENLRIGGNFGMAIGDITFIEASPMLGYQFTQRLQAGVGFTYNYYADNTSNFSTSIFGGSMYAQFKVLQVASPALQLALRAECGMLNHALNLSLIGENRGWVFYPLVGGSLLLPVATNGALTVSALWNLNEDIHSIYVNPIIRVGFTFGF